MVLNFFTKATIMLIVVSIIIGILKFVQERCYNEVINKIVDIMYIILNIAVIIFFISNIVMFIYGIVTKNILFTIVSVMFAITMIFYGVSEYTYNFSSIFELTACLYGVIFISFFMYQMWGVQNNIRTDVRKVNTINIIGLQEVPYTNVYGRRRRNIRSEPSIVYYYDIITESGRTTTKVIDGYNNYVEKFEDDIYKENPHIDVFKEVQKYTNGYGKEYEEFIRYQYYIYIPKGGTYYIDKE